MFHPCKAIKKAKWQMELYGRSRDKKDLLPSWKWRRHRPFSKNGVYWVSSSSACISCIFLERAGTTKFREKGRYFLAKWWRRRHCLYAFIGGSFAIRPRKKAGCHLSKPEIRQPEISESECIRTAADFGFVSKFDPIVPVIGGVFLQIGVHCWY